ncbi:MAG: hypothetical protein WAW36_11725 [Methylovulum miyakonense]|uniref:hypothetical protein n=1 Tax=Methylovulum miyakonense TaxID=645578 RepID=UPI003BB7C952
MISEKAISSLILGVVGNRVHLTTGHILELDNDKADKEYWICLSSACDLVPDQKISGLFGRVKGSMPFTVVQLTKIGGSKALEDVKHNIYLFLNIHNEINTFFHPGGQLHNPPVWGQIIAEKYGKGITHLASRWF